MTLVERKVLLLVLYLLDANVLIRANHDYYPIARVPEFWDWLLHHGEAGNVKVPVEVYEEIREGNDELGAWARDGEFREKLILDELADPAIVAAVIDQGYAANLTDDEIEKLGRDPFLIAYCLVDLAERTLVTMEVSKPRRTRANRHIPDVCQDQGVPCIDTFQFTRALDFRTNWRHG